MDFDEALELVESAIKPKQLTDLQEMVFSLSWVGKSYVQIADETGYGQDYVRHVGQQLWTILSEAFDVRVGKSTLRTALRQYHTKTTVPIRISEEKQKRFKNPSSQISTNQNPQYGEHNRLQIPASIKAQDWGEAIHIFDFYGRLKELANLEHWINTEHCQLVTVIGMGGVGKTTLVVQVANSIQGKFEFLFFRSLRNTPPFITVIHDLILFVSEQQATNIPESTEERISFLISKLRQHRCLIILDNCESILQSGQLGGRYKPGYEDYGQLFRRIADEQHQSCLIITSRERPISLSMREGENASVRSLALSGLPKKESQKILQSKGLVDVETNSNDLVEQYSGNPLALNIVASTIRNLFSGQISEFLAQGSIAFGNIWDLLDNQFNRLSTLEKHLMYWLAINRLPVSISDLKEDLVPKVSSSDLLTALESLNGRSLININQGNFTQQPVVMEYVTELIIKRLKQEFFTNNFNILFSHSLIKAQTKDYIREAQVQLFLQPIVDFLVMNTEGLKEIELKLYHLLDPLRGKSFSRVGYAAGNLLNLMGHLNIDLEGHDFSHLTISQAFLTFSTLRHANFSETTFIKSIFAETFGSIAAIAFSPNGKLLATGDSRGHIHIRNVEDGKQLVSIKGHLYWIWELAFSPDSQILASASDDCCVKLWHANTGECLQTLKEHTFSVTSVTFGLGGLLIATGSQDSTIKVWRLRSEHQNMHPQLIPSQSINYECVQTLRGHVNRVWSVIFSKDSQILFSTGEDQTFRIWNIKTGHCIKSWSGHENWIKSATLSPDDKIIASGSFDNSIKLWNSKTGECINTLYGHTDCVSKVSFSPDGCLLASSSYDSTIKLWNIASGQCIKSIHGHNNRVWSVEFGKNIQELASGADDHTVKLWDIHTGRCTKAFQGYTNTVLNLSISSNFETIASGHEDNTVKLWNPNTGECIKTLRGHKSQVWAVEFAPAIGDQLNERGNDCFLIASSSVDRTVKLWNWQTGKCLATLKGHKSIVWAVSFSPDGQWLVSGSYDKTARVWCVKTGDCHAVLQDHSSSVSSVIFSPNGQWLSTSSFDQTIKLWCTDTWQCIKTLQGHGGLVRWSVFSSDSQHLFSCSYDLTARQWDIESGECLNTFEGHSSFVVSIAVSPDDRILATGTLDGIIKVWDIKTGECLNTIKAHTAIISALEFIPVETLTSINIESNDSFIIPSKKISFSWVLISSSFDETIKLWSIESGENLNTLRPLRPYEKMNITGIKGLTGAQILTLKALGAVDS